MKVTLSTTGVTLNVLFVHSSHGAHLNDFVQKTDAGITRTTVDNFAKELGRRLTLCEISEVGYSGDSTGQSDEEVFNVLGQGWSVCHPNDVFEKRAGRKLAFGKALVAAGIADRGVREELWNAYLNEYEPAIAEAKFEQARQAFFFSN